MIATVSSTASAAPLSIAVQGNHFVNGAGQPIRLLGVNHASFEYACFDGFGYDDGHMDDADAAAIASWGANAVRVPLNEDCWMGINEEPDKSQEALTMSGYRAAVEAYVASLHAHGLYAILDLHWSAPGAMKANGQEPMPDSHSASFWESVASQFKNDPADVFDVFNEPYSPADPRSGDDPAHPVSWSCWVEGGCALHAYQNTDELTTQAYQAVGMQTLVDSIRNTGATQPVLVGGLDYANDLTGWVEHAPNDPLNQEAASFHNYMGKTCDNLACWNSQIAPVAANVPVVTGEFDEDNFLESTCPNKTPSNFDQEYMGWADGNGVGYLAWGWEVLSQAERDEQACSAFYLTEDPGGTPAAPNGVALHDHLAALAAGPGATPGSTTSTGGQTGPPGSSLPAPLVSLKLFKAAVRPGSRTVAFTLSSPQSCTGTLTGQTVGTYAATSKRHKRHHVSLGSVRFTLKAGKAKTVALTLSRASRTLLAAKGRLRVQITIALTSPGHRRTVITRTLTLVHR